MKKWLPWMIAAVFAAWVAGSLRMPPEKDWAYREFGRLPITSNGRIQPMDSLARNTLLQLREKQTANLEPWKEWYQHPKIISADEWLVAVITRSGQADAWPVFRIDNPDVKGLLGLPADPDPRKQQDGKHYSWLQIQPKFTELARETERANQVEKSHRNAYDQSLLKLWEAQTLYKSVKNALGPAGEGDMDNALKSYLPKVEAGRTAFMAEMKEEKYDSAALDWMTDQLNAPLVVPPENPGARNQWLHAVEAVIQSANTGAPPNIALAAYEKISRAYRADNPSEFNAAVAEYRARLAGNFMPELKKAASEQFFNFYEPFYKAMVIFVAAFLLVLGYWIKPGQWDWMRRAAVGLVLVALVVHTSGLLFRMFLEGRPPVTNLYSSAIFIGWGATILGLMLERFWRNSIGVMVSSIIGFLTLIIAHHLRLGGDTMEMMQAVLDTNFWLATHVVVVTLGYASTFVAGCLAVIYIVQGVFTRALTQEMSRSLARMIYGIICFATLFSFVGTVLGGIWADQSWGRFWGWDPKENGALIIVLWNALILHARWGGLVRERGLANLAIVGNIVTSWSWFGVNMLGIGLHSYGFTSAAFRWLVMFMASQLVLIGLGLLPKHLWLSFREPATARPREAGRKKTVAAST
jgi:ABC-type transport system involved in cytochrome c biogenesis permease subunit